MFLCFHLGLVSPFRLGLLVRFRHFLLVFLRPVFVSAGLVRRFFAFSSALTSLGA